jgi:hypothetical protein
MLNQGHYGEIRTLECPHGVEYDEETFLYFLSLEQARAAHSSHQLRLLLVSLEPVPGEPVLIPRASASRLFEGFRLWLRETDVMGWYRQDRVAGAVLSARPDALGPETSGFIEQRVREGLQRRLPANLAGNLRVRIVQHGPRRFANA